MYVYPVRIGSTGNMAATCALAARVYLDIDPEFAQTCLKAAKRAYAWLEANPDSVYIRIPETIYLSEDTPLLKTYVDSLEYYRFNEWVVDSTPLTMWLVLDRMIKAAQ